MATRIISSRNFSVGTKKSRRTRNRSGRLACEALEDRRVLAVVTSLADSGAGSLRDTIAAAPAGDTITFDLSGTIALTSAELVIDKALTIDGSGQNITISGGGALRVFNVDDGNATADKQVVLQNLTIVNGFVPVAATPNSGGGVRNVELLEIRDSTISGSFAANGGGASNVDDGDFTATNVNFVNNMAYYGGGGFRNFASGTARINGGEVRGNTAGTTNASTYSSFGGGLLNTGNMTVDGTTIADNTVDHTDLANYGAFGGGISNTGGGTTTIQNGTITGNLGELGGGLHAGNGMTDVSTTNVEAANMANRGGGVLVSGSLEFTGGAIRNNASLADVVGAGGATPNGGGLSAGANTTTLIDGTELSGNNTAGRGGAIYAATFGTADASTLTVKNATIVGNTAEDLGGGINAGSAITVDVEGTRFESNFANNRGGAIYVSTFGSPDFAATIEVDDSQFLNNSAAGPTGTPDAGALLLGTNTDATIRNSVISGNTSLDRGGAIYASNFGTAADAGIDSSIAIYGTTFENNSGRLGGAVLSGTNMTTTVDDVQFLSNSALEQGGGLYLSSFQTLPLTTRFHDAVITNSTFQGNNAEASSGGGLRFSRTSSVDVRSSTFSGNTSAGGDGGGIRATNSLSLDLEDSTLSGNSAYVDGGGMSFVNVYATTVQNTTVSGNRAAGDGGGIWASFDYLQTFGLNFSTITGNRSNDDMVGYGFGGGGLLTTGGYADIRNSIISGNSDGMEFANDFAEQALANVAYTLIEDPAGHSVMNGVNGNIVGVSAQLGPLSNNGGPTQTHLPMAGSPAIDAADPAATLMEDQRGFSRPGANASRDMGSVETDGVSPMLNLDFNNDGLYNCGDMDLLEAAIDGGTYNASFDVNQDLLLNSDDVFAWLMDAGELRFGAGRFSYRVTPISVVRSMVATSVSGTPTSSLRWVTGASATLIRAARWMAGTSEFGTPISSNPRIWRAGESAIASRRWRPEPGELRMATGRKRASTGNRKKPSCSRGIMRNAAFSPASEAVMVEPESPWGGPARSTPYSRRRMLCSWPPRCSRPAFRTRTQPNDRNARVFGRYLANRKCPWLNISGPLSAGRGAGAEGVRNALGVGLRPRTARQFTNGCDPRSDSRANQCCRALKVWGVGK